ncbi:hypothetical protein [Nannocystis pusilla]|uniref:Cytochrome c domain-containing protein n=1 Tax=Nannocystis pusilla TaxID=889268 RepID=A0ABS7U4B3_9BACT|nr:hypothetical protein [Nannocystis pusilla]MBZ5715310.1 hypothetical protein [Nannocystis pusilla]
MFIQKLCGPAALVVALAGVVTSGCSDPGPGLDSASETGDPGTAGTDGTDGTAAPTTTDAPEAAPVTWHQHIAPIMVQKCSGCHSDGGIAPFSLASYDSAKPFAPGALDAVERGTMPPFLADETDDCQPRHGWQDDPRLSDDELELLRAWVEQGAPEGDPAAAAPLPEPPEVELTDADVRVQIPTPVSVDGDKDQFLCFSIDPGFEDDTWIDAVQITAGNPQIVHHVLAYVDESGASAEKVNEDGYYPCFGGPGINSANLIAAWAPGMTPFESPPNVASRIAAGSRIVLNVHYHPTGKPELDSTTSLDLRIRDTIPEYVGMLALIGNSEGPQLLPSEHDDNGYPEFRIPAGVEDHVEQMLFKLDDVPPLRVFAVGTHMHYVGTDMLIGLQRPSPDDGEPANECLLQTPGWDFNWQRTYSYDAPLDDVPRVSAGDELYLRCNYNNSMSNPHVVAALAEQGLAAPKDVVLGEETLDEMCLAVVGIAIALKDAI